jgi:hypothetical protein
MNVNLSTLEDLGCECGNNLFVQGITIKVLPAILSPNGQAGITETPAYRICTKCSRVWPLAEIINRVKAHDNESAKKIIIL